MLVLAAAPPGVVTVIFPVCAPVGTVAVICESELTVKLVACTPPNDTLVAPVKLMPVITTAAPTGPLVGLKLSTLGTTRNFVWLLSVPIGVVTVREPLVAPQGTTAVR